MIDSLLSEIWVSALKTYQQLVVGFSGGLDSTVLLHALARYPQLRDKMLAVHVHHGLSEHAEAWQVHCQRVCDVLAIPLEVRRVEFDRQANIEEHARDARYTVFSSIVGVQDALLLAHHQDDQAETLLLQLLRGAGVDGLAAMPSVKLLLRGVLVRPLLHHTRQALEVFARQHELVWIEDDSNQNILFSRNYLRHSIMPMLKQKWPNVVQNLSRTAEHCQQARRNLNVLATLDCDERFLQGDCLPLAALCTQEPSRLINILRVWLKNNMIQMPSSHTLSRIVDELILANTDAVPCIAWATIAIKRYQNKLYVLISPQDSESIVIEYPTFPGTLLYPLPIGSHAEVRFRQGGEVFHWCGQTKILKKLFQQWRVPPWQRDHIPLIFIDDCLAAVVGYAISDRFL